MERPTTDPTTKIPPPPRPIEYRDVDPSGWWLSIIGGLALVALGIWLLANPFRSVMVLAALVGVSLILGGIVEAIGRGGSGDLGWPVRIAGGLLVGSGILVLAWPDITLRVLAVLAGAGLVLAGLLRAATAVSRHGDTGRAGGLPLAGLTVAAGVVVLAWPDATVLVLAVLLGLRAVATGVVAIAVGWQTHRLAA